MTLRDRSKDMIISGGSNIYPREIEEVLLRHPDLVEVSVVGRPHPEWGEEVVAFVVRAAGAEIAPEALDQLCLDHIARFKRPRHYRFVDALPKNNYGKVLKTELRRLLASRHGRIAVSELQTRAKRFMGPSQPLRQWKADWQLPTSWSHRSGHRR